MVCAIWLHAVEMIQSQMCAFLLVSNTQWFVCYTGKWLFAMAFKWMQVKSVAIVTSI